MTTGRAPARQCRERERPAEAGRPCVIKTTRRDYFSAFSNSSWMRRYSSYQLSLCTKPWRSSG